MFKFNSNVEEEHENSFAIEVDNISKSFRIPHEKRTTVYENIVERIKGKSYNYETLEALKCVSFKVKKGESFGIIGQNGSGKSTLLKIIAGVLIPDSGSVKVRRDKLAPFLELGVGFQPELTAIENVYLYGSIMGITSAVIDSKINSIFEFAELNQFIDTKLKNFSSGMYARLAFSTAISTDPDILLIDEALSVGDEAFQRKCFDVANEYKRKGKTIVFVSHSLETVCQLCENSMLLYDGGILSIGKSEKVIGDYLKRVEKKIYSGKDPCLDSSIKKEAEIIDIIFLNDKGEETKVFSTEEKLTIKIKYLAKTKIEKPVFGVSIYHFNETHVNGTNTKLHNYAIDYIEGKGEVICIINSLGLLQGTYFLSATIYDHEITNAYDHREKFEFKIFNGAVKDEGLIFIPWEWMHKRLQ